MADLIKRYVVADLFDYQMRRKVVRLCEVLIKETPKRISVVEDEHHACGFRTVLTALPGGATPLEAVEVFARRQRERAGTLRAQAEEADGLALKAELLVPQIAQEPV